MDWATYSPSSGSSSSLDDLLAEAAANLSYTAAAVPRAAPSPPRKILIVSACPAQGLVIKSTLRGRNHTVEEAQNGDEAIKYFVEDKKCDLVFIAKKLPKMDGLQTIRSLKDIGVDIPIIASSPTEDEKELFMSAGATEFIAEPVCIFDVLRIVDKYLLGEQPGNEIE